MHGGPTNIVFYCTLTALVKSKKSKVKLFYSAPESLPESWLTQSAAIRNFFALKN